MIRLLVVALMAIATPGASVRTQGDFALSARCPPGFEKTGAGVCELRTLYQFYPAKRGLGGTRTALPPHRDGFTPQQIDLGRYLFFDPVLSGDGSLSCASCHDPARGLSDGRPRSIGIHGADAGRAAPTLWNVTFLKTFSWDARAHSLEAQATGPIYSVREMGNSRAQLLASLNGNATYRRLFRAAFPQGPDQIAEPQIMTALAAFESSLVSLNSRYDRYVHGYDAALTEREIQGLNVFRSFVARCSECHTPPLFTNEQIAVIGMPEAAGRPFDIGAQKTFGAEKLKGGFKVPTLRNIARTAPYSHDGAFADLRSVVEFYNKGRGNAVPKDMHLYLHWHISDPHLTDAEVDRIVDFLGALTDETFLPQVPARVPSGLAPTIRGREIGDRG
ncbi:MAG TPA: cytochrome c peroxidase [Steroidobacteraceae bacterium]|nr:cytochrome c peroxidase [Steroidobacteraceae bacterium]